jgi:hypothetical protein
MSEHERKETEMRWSSKRMLATVAGVAALGGGAGIAYATSLEGGDEYGETAGLADVAGRLGVSEEDLVAAFQAEALERLDTAVADGRIGEEQAARIRARIEEGDGPLLRLAHGHRRAIHPLRAGIFVTAADYLELEPRELLGELRGDVTLAEVAERHGKTAEGLEEALVEEARERIHHLVNDGSSRAASELPG